ncbi:coiled-coil domain-containing protein 158 [Porphyrio hochstetteri]
MAQTSNAGYSVYWLPLMHMISSRGGVCSQGYGVGLGDQGQVAPNGSGGLGHGKGSREYEVINAPLLSQPHGEEIPPKIQEKQISPVSVRGKTSLRPAARYFRTELRLRGRLGDSFVSRRGQATELHEQQRMGLRPTIADLQPKLMEVQLERDALQDTKYEGQDRQKESQSQENVKIQLENTIKELEAANQLQEEMLREADCEAERLKKMVHSHEEVLLELRGILMDYEGSTGRKLCEHEPITSLHIHNLSTAFADVLRDLDSEVSYLKEKVVLAELHKKEIELSVEKEQNKRFWDRNTDNSITIDHLRRELDNKTMRLERMENAVKDMRTECHRQMERQVAVIKEKKESLERISSLTLQLESTKEALCKVKDDLTAKQIDLKTAEEKVSHLMAHLQEKERALEVASKETKKLHSQLGSRMRELQHLKEGGCLHSSECEALKLQLMEKERIIKIFQKQIDSMTQIAGQHSGTAGAMEVEKSQLMKERNDWKLKAEELKIAKDEKEARIHEMEATLSELEREKVKLINTCSERLQALNSMRLEKDQLMNELQASQSELAGLAEGFEDLKRDYQDKMKEMGNTANRLKMQLKSAQAELEWTRTALKTMEGSDGHAVKVAVGMQKQITANRGQIDALQSKMKFLEEAMTNAAKEKRYLREENSKLSQELSCIRAENTKIVGELEILRSRDKHLKEKIPRMETALDKASLQLAECRCIIQCQEQEAMCFRLQHALDVKELQGPGYSAPSTSGKLQHTVPLSHLHSAVLPPPLNLASSAAHVPSKPGVLKEEPLQDLKRILQELTSSGSDTPAVDPGKDDGSGILHAYVLQIFIPQALPCLSHPLRALVGSLPNWYCEGQAVGYIQLFRSQPTETSENTPRRLQNKMGSLQSPLESLQINKPGPRRSDRRK